MPLKIQSVLLLSRAIRENISRGRTGASVLLPGTGQIVPRRIVDLTKLGGEQNSGGLLERVWNTAKSFAGFVGGLIKGIAFSATAVWGWLIGRVEQLKNFDWNASDKELEKMLDNQNTQLAAIWGSVVGQGLGWLAGIAIGGGIAYLCPVIGSAALAKMIMSKTAKEAFEEVIPSLQNAIVQTIGAFANRLLVSGYTNYRRLLKKAPLPLLESIYGKENANFIKNVWGNEGGPNMSFNVQMEEFLDSINNQALRVFLENLFEEAWDSFTEAGFIVANELDSAFQQAKMQSFKEQGTPRSVRVTPDIQGEEQLTFTAVPQQMLYPVVQQTLNTHRMIYGRDIGQLVGQPESEWARARPQLRQLTIVFRDKEKPPWRHPDGKRCREATYAIPDVRFGLTWVEVKLAAKPFLWGRYRATAQLDNQRQMVVYGASPAEAKDKLRELLRLTTANVLTLSVAEEEDRPVRLRKDPTRMYPVYGSLLARRNSVDETGRVTISNQVLDEEVIRFSLWVDQEPPNLPPLR